ncbi:TPA: IS21 family transposase [Streptococcus pyogenes]|nr:IS21 family transposase [Streptococcus pyogenes]HEQ8519155.1 IS21 family transposase [Streptococcus pyogenes]
MDKNAIIRLKNQGYSNREAAKILKIDRKTIGKYWNEYKDNVTKLDDPNLDRALLQEKIAKAPSYDSSNRKKVKYTKEVDEYLDEILAMEKKKDKVLKNHKQQLSVVQIHKMIIDKGFDISYPSIAVYVRKKRNLNKECFIKQEYDFADRLEYDFGEVKLLIFGKLCKLYIAVLSSPASNFRWAYLYKSQDQEVFFDSQVRFFDMIGGMYREVVYDNMKNVVHKFVGRNEKKLNPKLIEFANYYGFSINVTNCFSGNEKGHVEGSVRIIRKKTFAEKYEFDSYEEACKHLEYSLVDLNKDSLIEEEKKKLLKLRPRYELASTSEHKVDKYSLIQVDRNKYSVPEYMVGRKVLVRKYAGEIKIYVNDKLLARHKRKDGANEYSIDINHYLDSLARKPGAIRNSLALKSHPDLKAIFDKYFTSNPKKFIKLLEENKGKDMDQLLDLLKIYANSKDEIDVIDIVKLDSDIEIKARKIVASYESLCIGGKYGN